VPAHRDRRLVWLAVVVRLVGYSVNPRLPRPPLFPYTTLFRSRRTGAGTHWSDEEILEYFPRLAERMETEADRLSGGEQQMAAVRSEEHTSELQSRENLVCRLLLEKTKHAQGLRLRESMARVLY